MVLSAAPSRTDFIFLAVVLPLVVVLVLAYADIVTRPDWAWKESGQSKSRWLLLTGCGALFGLIYLLNIRPKVAAAERRGRPPGDSGEWSTAAAADPPGWYPDPALRHQYRRWDGKRWTDEVDDFGFRALDPA